MANSRPFMDLLREHRNGVAHDELSDALQELVAAVAQEGKGGTLTLKISVKPADSKGGGALLVADEITVKPPKLTKGASVFFASPENNLVREDPRQSKLALQEIGQRDAPREIGSTPASVGKALA